MGCSTGALERLIRLHWNRLKHTFLQNTAHMSIKLRLQLPILGVMNHMMFIYAYRPLSLLYTFNYKFVKIIVYGEIGIIYCASNISHASAACISRVMKSSGGSTNARR